MKILHISHTGLPDTRIEKAALSNKQKGHEPIFLGGRESIYQNFDAFDSVNYCEVGNDLEVALNPFVRHRWLKRIEEINPDIIHAHNIIVGRFLLETDLPAVYDDHEYWSKEVFKYDTRKMPRGLSSKPLKLLIPHWEKKMLRKYPTLTINRRIAREHKRYSSWVGIIPNYPLLEEVQTLQSKNDRKGVVYVGNDFLTNTFSPHRNMAGLRQAIEFDVISGHTHQEMMQKLTSYKIGITPWRPHPFHKYCLPNKNFEYLHAGLQTLVSNSLYHFFEDNPYVKSFTSYTNLREKISFIEIVDHDAIMKYARSKFIWDKYESVLYESYRKA